MAPFSWRALSALIAVAACSTPKPPEGNVPEAPAPSAPDSEAPAPSPPATGTGATGEAGSQGAEPVVQTLFVRERLADCQGEGERKCLQVREVESGEWRNFYASIEGFDYEEGNAYEIRVEVTEVPRPPADASSLRYRLLEMISKRKVITPKTVQ
jgi:hypothetical protein